MSTFWNKLTASLRAFNCSRSGNVAITFAIATLPVIGAVGAAVDYSRANSVKAAMQAALDSTALMLSRDAATVTDAQLQTKAKNYFLAMFNRPDANSIVISASYSATGGSQVTVDGQANVPTALMSAVGYDYITVKGTATSKWGSERLRVALVLDVTGSMSSDGKMTAMKTATKNLISQLKGAAAVNGDVYVSIVPFNKDVNVGSSNYNASWIDWEDWDDDNGYDSSTTTCTTTKTGKNGKSTKKCTTSTTWVPYNHNTWNGCITDRDQNYDQNVTAPSGSKTANPSPYWPAEQFDSCPKAMMGLTYDWTALNNLVDSLQPVGNTNQPIGLVWGWQSLVGGGPLTAPAKDSNYKYKEIIILLSDGMNTENRWSGSQTQIDKRMYDSSKGGIGTCANAKAAGIEIYSIQVNTGNDPTSTVMQNCASNSDKFFMLTSASAIVTTFSTIGTNLTKLRVAK
ncbi:MAG: pilus assembly protein TadG-related protein [Xanthobacteraceae bacterium]|uniref:TadE/TadG family type IV pilus assembly protein n=1 Tax=Pseudolabrys sp. TaxID=1960880 RepID=UPI003D0B294A